MSIPIQFPKASFWDKFQNLHENVEPELWSHIAELCSAYINLTERVHYLERKVGSSSTFPECVVS